MKEIGIQGKYLTYKGKPLVRKGNEIYYGDLSDSYYLYMMIMSEKSAACGDLKVPEMILVQIKSTSDHSILEKKQKMVNGSLYEALDLGCAWLERAIAS